MAKKAAKELKATHKHEKSAIGNAWKVIFFGLGVSFAGFCLFAGMLISLETTP
ncbi:MAG: hypothetical protein JKY92_02890 [Magnetovibrio sp.]|nr:hypothetical protein [Magnetovibrio sp.]